MNTVLDEMPRDKLVEMIESYQQERAKLRAALQTCRDVLAIHGNGPIAEIDAALLPRGKVQSWDEP